MELRLPLEPDTADIILQLHLHNLLLLLLSIIHIIVLLLPHHLLLLALDGLRLLPL